MKCCSAQLASCWENPEKTLKKAKLFIEKAASLEVSIIVFPEQFATGWDPCSHKFIQNRSGSIVSTLKKYAKEYSIALLGSFREQHHPLPHNTAVVIDGEGSIKVVYAKMHPFTPAHEERRYSAGDNIAIFNIDKMKFGIAICYDLRFPSLFQIYAKQGVHGVFIPAAWPASRIEHWELFIKARAVENQMYIIGVNTVGKTPVDEYLGSSMTVDPKGSVIAKAGEVEELLISDLDANSVENTRQNFPAHKDIRTDLYQKLHEKED
ncbi:MAG: nitrilase-related carbon-nitrogen hydrolase [Methanoregulaceae archaeon]|jgi:predicted amidohydrolase